jgi:hypothetical protein
MVRDNNNSSYNFGIKGKEYEVFYTEQGTIEIYEVKNPGKTGFIFEDKKVFNLFINSMTDVASKQQEKEGEIF